MDLWSMHSDWPEVRAALGLKTGSRCSLQLVVESCMSETELRLQSIGSVSTEHMCVSLYAVCVCVCSICNFSITAHVVAIICV